MQQYTSRRRRCWSLLKELDKEIVLSEGHKADLLLDLSGLDRHERTMIMASIGNARNFDRIAEALAIQHPRIHLRESKRPMGAGKGQKNQRKGGKYRRKGGKRSWKGKPSRKGSSAYVADDYDYDYDYDAMMHDEIQDYADPAHVDADDSEAKADAEAQDTFRSESSRGKALHSNGTC